MVCFSVRPPEHVLKVEVTLRHRGYTSLPSQVFISYSIAMVRARRTKLRLHYLTSEDYPNRSPEFWHHTTFAPSPSPWTPYANFSHIQSHRLLFYIVMTSSI